MRVCLPALFRDEPERRKLTRSIASGIAGVVVLAIASIALAIPAQALQTTQEALDITIDGNFADWQLGATQRAPDHIVGGDSSRWSFTEPNPGTCAIDRWGSDSSIDTLSQVGTFTPALGGRPSSRLQNYIQHTAASRHCFQIGSNASGGDLQFLHSLERLALPSGSGGSERVVMNLSCSLLDASDAGANIEAMACVRVVRTQSCPVSAGCAVGDDVQLRVYSCE